MVNLTQGRPASDMDEVTGIEAGVERGWRQSDRRARVRVRVRAW